MKQTEMRIYNLFPRYAGSIDDWEPHLDRAYNMGFNWVYLNPVNFPGFSGSLYSIKEYYRMNPAFNPGDGDLGWETLRRLMERWKGRLNFMIDLVINHTAIDSPLTEDKPKWFKHNEDGSIMNPSVWQKGVQTTVWGDLAEIDNENKEHHEDLWAYWDRLVLFYLNLGFQGFRCDAAYMVPEDLWKRLIALARKHSKSTLFLAETLGCEFEDVLTLFKAGFDYSFNSSKYWDFQSSWCLEQYRTSRLLGPSVSFPESHDTERLMTEYNFDIEAVKARIAFEATFSSGFMITTGTEFGFAGKPDVVKTTPEDMENTGVDLTKFIKLCNEFKSENIVFSSDCHMQSVPQSDDAVLCLLRTHFNEEGHPVQAGIVLINTNRQEHRRSFIKDLADLTGINGPFRDVSPEHPMDRFAAVDFEYWLRPSQIKILVQDREEALL